VSDPGEDLVETCYENGIKVLVIPGACAAVSALAVSGLSSGRFVFEGFLSVSKKQRNLRLNELSREERTIIFYEAPHKLIATLEDFLTYFGDRRISISRELTKIHEETVLTTVSLALEHYRQTKPRGEFVLVLEGASRQDSPEISEDEAVQILQNYREKGYSLKESARLAAADSGYKKNRLYDMALSCDENA
ncbi:MAG: 16S rRNA (cytidine(1402)-2'-O)-methyltransferase, partial [Ruminococcaceae bacterium]|nr:16S rRNA (cytidine(1402)-2'-O)-methyltransferase [Oscillospiraceae bacterium]